MYNADSVDNINHRDAAAYAPCNPAVGGRYEVCNNNYVTNPFRGVNGFQGTGAYPSTTMSPLDLTRPFPQFGDVTEYQLNDERSWYNSLQVTGYHKWNSSLTLHANWTWSKLMDAGGFADTVYRVPSRTVDGNDRTHRITISGVYLLPVGRNRTFLSHADRLIDGAIDGWELAGAYIYQTGTPWALPGGTNSLGSAYVKPHIQQDNKIIRLVAPCVEQYKENSAGQYFSGAAAL